MGPARAFLLWCSANRWMSRTLPRYRFVQRAVRRFMPGEKLEAALEEGARLAGDRLATLLTCLGEGVSSRPEAEAVCAHYLHVIEEVARRGLDAEVSLKLTHLGLDADADGTAGRLLRIARAAKERGSLLWIDMEQSRYVDATLSQFRGVRRECDNVGVCLQAYLHRTPADLEALRPLYAHVRLVKGAYRESRRIALARKRDVDAAYLRLAERLLRDSARNGTRAGIATHDAGLIARVVALARDLEIPPQAWEVEMLYGINPLLQRRLAREGHRVRVLISYGDHWFAWYARRLAERPANILFVLRSLSGGFRTGRQSG